MHGVKKKGVCVGGGNFIPLHVEIPWTEGPGGAVVYGVAESDTTKQLTHTHTHKIKLFLQGKEKSK